MDKTTLIGAIRAKRVQPASLAEPTGFRTQLRGAEALLTFARSTWAEHAGPESLEQASARGAAVLADGWPAALRRPEFVVVEAGDGPESAGVLLRPERGLLVADVFLYDADQRAWRLLPVAAVCDLRGGTVRTVARDWLQPARSWWRGEEACAEVRRWARAAADAIAGARLARAAA